MREIWKPILREDLNVAAGRVIGAIARELSNSEVESVTASETAEIALSCAYLALADSGSGWGDRSVECLNRAIDRMSDSQIHTASFYRRLSKTGWILEHVSLILVDVPGGRQDSEDGDDPLEEIDSTLLGFLERQTSVGTAEEINLLVQMGIYFLERIPNYRGRRGIELIVHHLAKNPEWYSGGIASFTPSHQLAVQHREPSAQGYSWLSVAQGVPAVVQFLGEAVLARIDEEKTYQLLTKGIESLFAATASSRSHSRCDVGLCMNWEPHVCRPNWFCENLVIAAVLYNTGSRLGREDWRDYGLKQFDECLPWSPGQFIDVKNRSLSLEALQIAHILNRMYQRCHFVRYREAANSWYALALILERPENGILDLLRQKSTHSGQVKTDDFPVSRSVGTVLALLASVCEIEPQWDRLLLLSGCERSWW